MAHRTKCVAKKRSETMMKKNMNDKKSGFGISITPLDIFIAILF